jgi:hypothetical protein
MRMAAPVRVQLGTRMGNKCVRCEHVWLPRMPAPAGGKDGSLLTAAVCPRGGTRTGMSGRRAGSLSGQLFQWMILTLVTASLVLTILLWPRQIVSAFPAAAQLYSRIGIQVNVLGLTIDNVTSRLEYEDGEPVLRIEGLIGNLNDYARNIPALTLTLRDASSEAIYTWSAEVADVPLPPRSRVAFTTSVPAPPAAAEQVEIRFSRGDEGNSTRNR